MLLFDSWRNGDSGDSVEHERILKNAALELIEIIECQGDAHAIELVKKMTGSVEKTNEPVKKGSGSVASLTGPQIMRESIRARDALASLQQLRHIIQDVVNQGR